MTDGVSNSTYTYNGDGDRVAQTVDSVETTYVLDVATPLTMVLSETTGSDTIHYLHGLGLVAESDGTSTDYFLNDGLGSVRQLTDPAANPLLAQTFDPFGNVYASAGTGQSAFGFTGEYADASGLLYLRARYYNPMQGRFFQRDVWGGNNSRPQSLDPYMYGLGNPVNYTDPSGQIACSTSLGCQIQDSDPIETDDRDLTDWLVRQLNSNMNDSEIAQIRRLNTASLITAGGGLLVGIGIGIGTCYPPAGAFAGGVVELGALALRIDSGRQWASLVKDRARYDYKHAIRWTMGESIRLCGNSGCEWLDYSVPGNINYAYVGRGAGFFPLELHAGGSYAEMCDPAHGVEPGLCPAPGTNPYINPDWAGKFWDDPTDFAAINLGIELYRMYPSGVTENGLKRMIDKFLPQLHRRDKPRVAYRNLVYGTAYPAGYFDGPGSSVTYTR